MQQDLNTFYRWLLNYECFCVLTNNEKLYFLFGAVGCLTIIHLILLPCSHKFPGFVICWTPHFVIGALQVYGSMNIPPITIFMVLYYLNSVANPIMFFVFHYKKQESVTRRTPSSETHLSVLSSLRQRLTMYSSSSNLNGSCKSLNIHQPHNDKNNKQCLLIRPEKVVFHWHWPLRCHLQFAVDDNLKFCYFSKITNKA